MGSLELTPVHNLILRYKGVYDFEGLYKLLISWFNDMDYRYIEAVYKDKSDTPFGNEVEWKMVPDKEVTDFVKYKLGIYVHLWDVKEFEAERHGKKVKLCDGRVKVVIERATVEFDYQNYFNSKRLEGLRNFMISKMFKKHYELNYIDPLEKEMLDLQAKIKAHLGMVS